MHQNLRNQQVALRVLCTIVNRVQGRVNVDGATLDHCPSHDIDEIRARVPQAIKELQTLSTVELAALNSLFSLDLSTNETALAFCLPLERVVELAGDLDRMVRGSLGIANVKQNELLTREALELEYLEPHIDPQTKRLEALSSELRGKGYDALLNYLRKDPHEPLSGKLVEGFVDSPFFWARLLSDENPLIVDRLKALAAKSGGLAIHNMPPPQRAAFALYLQLRFESLDDVECDLMLALALGKHDRSGMASYQPLENTVKGIAAEIVQQGYFPASLPDLPPLLSHGRLSLYYDQEALDLDAIDNLRRFLGERIHSMADLERFRDREALLEAVGLAPNTGLLTLAHYLSTHPTARAPLVSTSLVPHDGYRIEKDDLEKLFFADPSLAQERANVLKQNGSLLSLIDSEEQFEAFRRIVHEHYPSLDQVRSNFALAESLGIRLETHDFEREGSVGPVDSRGMSIARMLVEIGVYSPHLSKEQCRSDSLFKLHCNPLVVGLDNAEHNRQLLMTERGIVLDDPESPEADIDQLARAGREGNLPFAVLGRYLHSPEHFHILIESEDGLARTLRNRVFSHDTGLQLSHMGQECFQAFSSYVHTRFPEIDSLEDAENISQVLGISKAHRGTRGNISVAIDRRQWKLAKRLIDLNIYSADTRVDYKPTRKSELSFLLMDRVVGEEIAQRNRFRVLTHIFPDLDSAHRAELSPSITKGAKSLLGLESSATVQEVARALFEQGYVSPFIPDNHPLPFHRMSFYFDESVVGIFAYANLGITVREQYKSIDEITDMVFANPIGTIRQGRLFAREVAHRGYLSSTLPEGQAPGRSNIRYGTTYFFDREIVTPEQFDRNVSLFFRSLPHLDQIRPDVKGIRPLKKILEIETWQIAARAVHQGDLSPRLPEDYTPASEQGNYFDPRVVGKERAALNREEYRERKRRLRAAS